MLEFQRRCPQIMGNAVKEENLPKSAQLPHETLTTMLACLQGCAGYVAPEHDTCEILLPRRTGSTQPHEDK
jgi:CCR4-NOT transcription complex subunit 1